MNQLAIQDTFSDWVYKKNNAILKAGKIRPTTGTKIAGKYEAVTKSPCLEKLCREKKDKVQPSIIG